MKTTTTTTTRDSKRLEKAAKEGRRSVLTDRQYKTDKDSGQSSGTPTCNMDLVTRKLGRFVNMCH